MKFLPVNRITAFAATALLLGALPHAALAAIEPSDFFLFNGELVPLMGYNPKTGLPEVPVPEGFVTEDLEQAHPNEIWVALGLPANPSSRPATALTEGPGNSLLSDVFG